MEEIKKERIDLADLYPTIREVLSRGGDFLLCPNGKSMLPTIRPGRDTVRLSPIKELKKGTLVLYRRVCGTFVLHRVVGIAKDGTYILRGDNQYYDERGITRDQMIAAVYRFQRGKRDIVCTSPSHKAYLAVRRLTYPVRRFLFRVSKRLKRSFLR